MFKIDGCDLLLWLDLETTGLDVFSDLICEAGWLITRPEGKLDILAADSQAVKFSRRINRKLSYVSRVMHEQSGLTDRMKSSESKPLKEIELRILCDISKFCSSDNSIVRIAGSGVSHFDLQFVKRLMPKLAERLHWCPLDVGQLEEWRNGMGFYTSEWPQGHRSLDDAMCALNEARWYTESWKV